MIINVYKIKNFFNYAESSARWGWYILGFLIALCIIIIIIVRKKRRDNGKDSKIIISNNVGVIISVLTSIYVIIFSKMSGFSDILLDGYAYIPKLEGMTEENAKKELSNLGFKIEIKEKYQKDIKLNVVYQQFPASGERKKVNDTTVTLYVNSKVMPDVKGYTLEKAAELLESMGMIVDVKREFSKTVKKEHIIRQSVNVGKTIESENKVTLTVSKGIKIPNVIGNKTKDAETKLKKYGLTVETESGYNAEYEENVVIAQRQKSEDRDTLDPTIVLTINQPIKIFVPYLYNIDKNKAHTQLLESGFLEKNITYEYEYSSDIAKGNVIRQSIGAGQEIDSRQAIVVSVSLGMKDNSSHASTQGSNNKKASSNNQPTNPEPVTSDPSKEETPVSEPPKEQSDAAENLEGDIFTDTGSDVIN